jgi:hypothetical protein
MLDALQLVLFKGSIRTSDTMVLGLEMVLKDLGSAILQLVIVLYTARGETVKR